MRPNRRAQAGRILHVILGAAEFLGIEHGEQSVLGQAERALLLELRSEGGFTGGDLAADHMQGGRHPCAP